MANIKLSPQGGAGYYGTLWTCDAPITLVTGLTKFNLAGTPDFIVWTGDNARHDADRQMPRTAEDIIADNKAVAKLMQSMGNMPFVPSIGNNDVYPHDTLCLVPNDPNLGNLSQIWAPFIPASQQATFRQIGSFYTDVSPQIMVVSLNTLEMFRRNKCSAGCHSGDPGDMVLSWLRSVLVTAQNRGATVYISGHVPPVADFWHNKCLENYAKLATEFQKIIAGHLYAHTHQDNYALLQNPSTGSTCAVINVAPSGVSSYNPSIRQYLYNPNTGFLNDYIQYFSNLTRINLSKQLVWEKEYQWSQTYGYRQWSLNNWIDLDQRISQQASLRDTYIKYRYVSSGLTQYMACSPQMEAAGACVVHRDRNHAHP